MTHIQIHRSSIAGATPSVETMLEGEIAVNLSDKKLFVKGATGELITLAAPQTHGDTDHVTSVNGLTGAVTLKPSGFEYEILSTSLFDVNTDIPSSGGIRLVRDYIGTTQITFNRYDKQGNDLLYPHVNLLNNGGTIYAVSEDGEKFFHILSPDRQTRSGHSFNLLPNNSVSASKFQFQDTTRIPNDGSPDDGLIAMETFSVGDKVFVHFIPNVAPPTTVDGISGEIFLSREFSLSGASGNTLGISLDNLSVVSSFNGATGTIDTTSLVLPVAGISGPSGITFSNGEVIRNSPDGSIQIIPSDEGGNHYGIEIDATEWGFGPAINVIDESGTQVSAAIRFDTDVVMSNTNVPDGTPARLLFNNASDRGFQQNNNGDGTVMFGVNGNNGHFAVGRKADLSDGERSMSADDKTALSMSNPQFLVYSADHTDANDYLRIEHDQTDANIFSGNGNINLAPAGGAVGISGGGLDIKASGITFADGTFQKSAARNGFRYAAGPYPSGDGTIAITIDNPGEVDKVQIKTTDLDGNDLTSLFTNLMNRGGFLSITKGDGSYILSTNVQSDPTYDGVFSTGEEEQSIVANIYSLQTVFDYDLDGDLNSGEVYVQIIPNNKIGVSTFNGSTGVVTFRNTDVATFTIDASSAIATGAKTKSLYRVPYDGTLTNFDVKTSATGGFTACVKIAGSDFANPTTGSVTGCSLGVAGFTGSSTVFNQATVTGGQFLYLDVFSNVSGSSAAQAFLTFESR